MSPPYMDDIFKPTSQPNTTTRASLLKLNQHLLRVNHSQNNISCIYSSDHLEYLIYQIP